VLPVVRPDPAADSVVGYWNQPKQESSLLPTRPLQLKPSLSSGPARFFPLPSFLAVLVLYRCLIFAFSSPIFNPPYFMPCLLVNSHSPSSTRSAPSFPPLRRGYEIPNLSHNY